jgi:hypothetical protein
LGPPGVSVSIGSSRSASGTCDGCWRSGCPITTVNDHIPRWVLDCRTNRPAERP